VIVSLKVHKDSGDEFRLMAGVNVAKAAAVHTNLLTVEQYDILVRCLHEEHVVRVYRVKQQYEAHAASDSLPRDLAIALDEMKSFEALMAEMSVPRLPAAELNSRLAMLAEGGSR